MLQYGQERKKQDCLIEGNRSKKPTDALRQKVRHVRHGVAPPRVAKVDSKSAPIVEEKIFKMGVAVQQGLVPRRS